MIEITLTGEVPAKKNSRIFNTKTHHSFPSKRYTEWHDLAVLQVRNQARGVKPIEKCVIKLLFIHGDLRRRDSDNGTSSVFDLLVDCNVLADDKWQVIKKYSVENDYEKNNARCEIKIETL